MKDNQFLKIRAYANVIELCLFEQGKMHTDKHPDYIIPYQWRESDKGAMVSIGLEKWERIIKGGFLPETIEHGCLALQRKLDQFDTPKIIFDNDNINK